MRRTHPLGPEPVARKARGTSWLGPEESWLENPRQITLSDLARMPIILCDARDMPLYHRLSPGQQDMLAVDEQRALDRIAQMLREVAPAFVSTPDLKPSGRYQGLELSDALQRTSIRDVLDFVAYLRGQGRTFSERPVRVTETYVAWLVDHGAAAH